ncbi:MAG TPA: cell division protein ZapA, partial [Novosphingobium sp.]|nr:cell division protein ZapA [Novosphingobium sp.]
IGEKLAGLPADVAASESRSLLFAALLLADELAEWREGLAPPPAPPAATLARLGNIALKIEQLADLFEAFGTAPG